MDMPHYATSCLWSHASSVWRIWTLSLLLLVCGGAWSEEKAATGIATAPTPTPIFTDQEWTQSVPATPPATGNAATPAIAGVLSSLLVVLLIAVVLGLLVKRFGMRRIMPGKGRHLEVVESLTIGYKRTVSLVRVGDQVLVLGQGEHDISHLATLPSSILELSRPTASAGASPEPPPDTGSPNGSVFRKALDKALGRTP